MTPQQFFDLYNGKLLEVTGTTALNQCVDLVNGFRRDVLGLPVIAHTNAVDFPKKISLEEEFIPNNPKDTLTPQLGDQVVFKKYEGVYGDPGHIAICTSADLLTINVFEENFPTGSVCKFGHHSYNGCIGWIRKKGVVMSEVPTELQQYGKGSLTDLVSYIDQLRKDRSEFDAFLSHLGVKTLEEATKLYDSKSATSEAQFKIITDKLETIKNTQDVAFSQLDTDRQNLDKIVITTASINDKQDTLTDNLTDFRKNVKEVVSTSTEEGNKPLLDKVEEIKKTLDTFVASKKVTLNVTETVSFIERIKKLFLGGK